MNDLIKVNYDGERPTVSGRLLHEFLGVSTKYTMWFQRQADFGFIEGQDFFPKLGESTGGRPAEDHDMTIDMAKQVCMIQRDEKGMAARKYFITIEDAWNQPELVMARALKLADHQIATLNKRVEDITRANRELGKKVLEDKPKVEFAEAMSGSTDLIPISEAAKVLNGLGYDIGRDRFFAWCRANGLHGKKGENYNLPTQYAMTLGIFQIIERVIYIKGITQIVATTRVTGKGMQYFVNRFAREASK